ncbi:MAG TPA: hypothetical protein VKM93_18050 [Terriglobia bacterium]|nr:hypothetical protein [Terriglobia bacterium]
MADERGTSVSSPARLAANRRNAQKSTGPRTAAGKRRAALNSQRRGLAPPEIERQLQGRGENPDDFRRLHRDLVALFPPQEASDETAVRVLAETWWEKARRLRDWAGEGKPVTRDLARDLDAKIDQLILFLVNKRMERHEKWHVRLTAVLGQGPGRVAVSTVATRAARSSAGCSPSARRSSLEGIQNVRRRRRREISSSRPWATFWPECPIPIGWQRRPRS